MDRDRNGRISKIELYTALKAILNQQQGYSPQQDQPLYNQGRNQYGNQYGSQYGNSNHYNTGYGQTYQNRYWNIYDLFITMYSLCNDTLIINFKNLSKLKFNLNYNTFVSFLNYLLCLSILPVVLSRELRSDFRKNMIDFSHNANLIDL